MSWREGILDFAPFILFGMDREGMLVFVKGRDAVALFGREPDRRVGKSIVDICKELPWLLGDLRRALAGEEFAGRGEVDRRWFELRYSVARDAEGQIAGVVCAATDITEGKQAEEAKTERAISLLTATLNATDDGMFTVDTSGNVGFVNQKFLSMWHLSEDIMRLPDFRQRMSFVLDQLKDPLGYQTRAQDYYAHPDRETFDVLEFTDGRVYERYSHPQQVDGVCVGRVLSFRDVTQQRRAEKQRDLLLVEEQAARVAAEAAERRAAFLAETTTLLASSLEYEGKLVAAARRAVPEIADGCIVWAFESTGIRCLEVVHADPKKREAALALAAYDGSPRAGGLSEALGRALASGEPLLVAEVPDEWLAAQASDAEHLGRLSALGLRSLITVPLVARGNALGAMMLLVTEPGRSYGPSDLAFAFDLARRVALAVDNARLYGEAERAIRVREEFVSIASHELRTPLTSLQLTVQTLLYFASTPALANAPPEVMQKLRTIERQCKKLGRLAGALLDVSRSSSGTFALELSDGVDLAKVAADVVSSLSDEIQLNGHQVSLVAPRPVVGRWDRLRLEQVLNNLLSNAFRHGARKPIAIRVEATEEVAIVSVRDQGEGIVSALRSKIFEKFERGTLSRSYGGLGLGLYITQQIVEGHGGTIEVQSELGSGSTFTVKLPRRDGRGPREP